MPLSFGIPIGLFITVIGILLFFITKKKRAARLVIGLGLFLIFATVALIILAVNSSM